MHTQIIFGLMAIALVLIAVLGASSPSIKDAKLKFSLTLPTSTSAVTASGSGILDTQVTTAQGVQPGNIECLITAPALSTAQLPDAKTMTYKLIQSANADLSSPSDIYGTAQLVQTGAGGVGALGATKRVRLPSDCARYVGLVATPSASGTGDASAASATLELVF